MNQSTSKVTEILSHRSNYRDANKIFTSGQRQTLSSHVHMQVLKAFVLALFRRSRFDCLSEPGI